MQNSNKFLLIIITRFAENVKENSKKFIKISNYIPFLLLASFLGAGRIIS